MAIKVCNLVWAHCDLGTSAKLVLLRLADHCDDNGDNLYPSIASLARACCLSEKQARRHVHSLIRDGYLQVVGNGTGGAPGTTRHYHLRLERLTGGSPPMDGPTAPTDGSPTTTVDGSPLNGATPPMGGSPTAPVGGSRAGMETAPICDPDGSHGCPETAPMGGSQTVIEPSLKATIRNSPSSNSNFAVGGIASDSAISENKTANKKISKALAKVPTKKARPTIALATFLENCRSSGEQPIPDGDPVFDYAAKVGIPTDILLLHWQEFKARYCEVGAKEQKDWRASYRNSVRGNWYKLWRMANDGACALTTVGEQARRAHAKDAA